MKQHTVPQNIMSVEFKIIGDLSIRQFIYISLSGGLAFIFWLTYLPGIIKYTLIFISVVLGLLVTFAKINERPFDQWITNFITAVMLPTQRIWAKHHELPYYLEEQPAPTSKVEDQKKEKGYQKVVSYLNSRNLPTDEMYKSNTVLDIEEIKMLTNIGKLMNQAMTPDPDAILQAAAAPVQVPNPAQAVIPPQQSNANIPIEPLVQPTTPIQPKVEIPVQQVAQPQHVVIPPPVSVPPTPPGMTSIPDPIVQPAVNVSSVQSPYPQVQTPAPQQIDPPIVIPEAIPDKEKPVQDEIITIEPNTVVKLDDLKNLKSSVLDSLDNELKSLDTRTAVIEPKTETQKQQTELEASLADLIPNFGGPLPPLPPKQTPETPPAPPVIVVPDTASIPEPKMEIPEVVMKEPDVTSEPIKTSVIEQPFEQIPEERVPEYTQTIDEPVVVINESDIVHPEDVVTSIQETEAPPVQPVTVDTVVAAEPQVIQTEIVAPDVENRPQAMTSDELAILQEENRRLREELLKAKTEAYPITDQQPEQVEVRDDNKILGHMPDFVNFPNVLSGVVVDSNDKTVEDVVIIIKNKSKQIMRAMKTNILGQFYSRNPLPNGNYDIEANKEGYVFENMGINLTGVVMKPMIIRTKKFSSIQSGTEFNLMNNSNDGSK